MYIAGTINYPLIITVNVDNGEPIVSCIWLINSQSIISALKKIYFFPSGFQSENDSSSDLKKEILAIAFTHQALSLGLPSVRLFSEGALSNSSRFSKE